MPKIRLCRHCQHTEDSHPQGDTGQHDIGTLSERFPDATVAELETRLVGCLVCGCVHFEPVARTRRNTTWLVEVALFEKNRWLPSMELRVQASTMGGASLKALRHVRRQRHSRRRIQQARVTLVRVPRT